MAISVADIRRTPEGYFSIRWGQPEYTDWIDESMSWKETCYIGDWSFLWERRFRGPDVLKLFSGVSVNGFAKFAVGQSKHVIHCNEAGKIINEGILSRLDQEELSRGRGRGVASLYRAQRPYHYMKNPSRPTRVYVRGQGHAGKDDWSAWLPRAATATTFARCCRFVLSTWSVASLEPRFGSLGGTWRAPERNPGAGRGSPFKKDNRRMDVRDL